jgi:CheY-like chemotaxis protein
VSDSIWALVVEDDAHSLIASTAILKELCIGYKRNTTGAQVVEQARAMQPKPDFILLSMDLSEGDPFAICRAIQSEPLLNRIPIIATGSTRAISKQAQIKAVGCAGFLLKPLPRKHLGGVIKRVLAGEHIWQEAV